jgi:hypothetical protein
MVENYQPTKGTGAVRRLAAIVGAAATLTTACSNAPQRKWQLEYPWADVPTVRDGRYVDLVMKGPLPQGSPDYQLWESAYKGQGLVPSAEKADWTFELFREQGFRDSNRPGSPPITRIHFVAHTPVKGIKDFNGVPEHTRDAYILRVTPEGRLHLVQASNAHQNLLCGTYDADRSWSEAYPCGLFRRSIEDALGPDLLSGIGAKGYRSTSVAERTPSTIAYRPASITQRTTNK